MTGSNIFSGSPTHILTTGSSRGASPTRAHSPRPTTTSKMPSPRSSPAMRPTSPLSPRFDSAARFESLQPPSPRSTHRPAGHSSRRANTNSLKLPSLPRFHPANFPSSHSSAQPTPDASAAGSPQPPVSPRTHQGVYSDVQRHLISYQREMVTAARASSPVQADNPVSPRLAPLGSPGPVTPLELEGGEGYLMAGIRSSAQGSVPSEEMVERMINEESARSRRTAGNSPSHRTGGR